MTRFLAGMVVLAMAPDARADPLLSAPVEAKTTAEVVTAAEQEDLRGGLHKEPNVSTAEYRHGTQKAFAAWYNPYSGEAACHVYVYVHDAKKGVWVRKLAGVFRGTHDVSVEFGRGVVIRDVTGKAVHRLAME